MKLFSLNKRAPKEITTWDLQNRKRH